MRCLCCGKVIRQGDDNSGWHKSCIRSFFGTETLPALDIDDDTIEFLAKESTNRGYTVPGVQKKMSLHLTKERKGRPRLTLINYPTGYILKPQTEEYRSLPEAEHLVMTMARESAIRTVPFALIGLSGRPAYITKRIDRISDGKNLKLLAMEDFCQLDGRLTQDKYKGSYERCGRIISAFSHQRGLDLAEFFLRVVFSFATGNSDMHLKNFSLIETDDGYMLSPAYDMLPVNVILLDDREQTALSLNGKKSNLRRKDFLALAQNCGISQAAAGKMIAKVVSLRDRYSALCDESLLPDDMKEALKVLIRSRTAMLG